MTYNVSCRVNNENDHYYFVISTSKMKSNYQPIKICINQII